MAGSGSFGRLTVSSIGRRSIVVFMMAMFLVASVPLMFSGGAMGAVPSEPLGLEGIAGDGQVTLNWTAPASNGGSPITGYQVHRGNASGNESLIASLGDTLAYVDADVVNGLTYWYCVTANNADGESMASNEIFSTPIGVPLAPYGIDAVAGDSSVGLNWTAPVSNGGSNITGYAIYRGLSAGSADLLVTVGNVTEFVDAGLVNGVTYWYSVSAESSYGLGTRSYEISATPVKVAASPIGLSAVTGSNSITLNWTAPRDIGGSAIINYTVYRGTEAWNLTVLVVLSDVPNYTDANVIPGRTYYYMVSATNGAGEGTRSDLVPALIRTVPSAVLDLTAIVVEGSVRLSWRAPEDDGGSAIEHYVVYRGNSVNDETVYRTIGGSTLIFTDTNVNNGLRYWYSIRASNAIGAGERSEDVAAVPITVPSVPTGLTASRNGTAVTLKWNAPGSDGGADISNYAIYRGFEGGEKTIIVTVGNVRTYTDTSVELGENYRYHVTALNEAGEGLASNEVSIVPITPPSEPIGLVGVAGSGQVTLNWTAPEGSGGSNISAYKVFRDDGTGAVNIATVGSVLTYIDEDVADGRSYLYYIVAVNNNGAGDLSNPIMVSMGGAAVVETEESGYDVYLLSAAVVLAAALLVMSSMYLRQRRTSK
ncbi:MAG: fibronectin type III domain-containing protein [Euryarchaeota archaeon]|nr:fibronectin type III domain-containing protein [Euryarchaeota archaeon]